MNDAPAIRSASDATTVIEISSGTDQEAAGISGAIVSSAGGAVGDGASDGGSLAASAATASSGSASAGSASAGAGSSGKAAEPPKKPAFPPAAGMPTQEGRLGLRYDFNQGARLVLPPRTEGSWLVRISDLDTGNVLFQSENTGAFVASAKRFYVRFRVEVWEKVGGKETRILEHSYDCRDREVVIQFPIGTLGDILAWFPYAARFQLVHGCKLTCAMSELIIPLLKDAYPQINFVTHEEMIAQKIETKAYATYSLGLFFGDTDCINQPTDFRHVGLHRTAGYILGVDPTEEAPRLAVPADETPPIAEPYVVIAVQSSTQCKYWNNPHGWREVVKFLKAQGLRVICIDQRATHGTGLVWNHIPNGAEDETGDRPLVERARWLRHAKAFIGLSSGLSWLAWAAGVPVVMISGFTHPTNEFTTPYRVINWHACNSCWNDTAHRFDHQNFMWCPRHADTPRQFECTRLITAAQVIQVIARVPGLIAAKTATKTETTTAATPSAQP